MISPTAWLERLEQSLANARAGDDPEVVHQVRVAAARLRVWLDLGGRRALVDDLRWLRRSASPVRDLDVLIAENPDPTCTSWLSARRVTSRAEFRAALDDERVGGLLTALAAMPALQRARARQRIAHVEQRVMRAGAELERDTSDVHAWHALRRALRRLRYALEWLDEDTDSIRAFLDVLGELNNRVVEERHLTECPPSNSATEALAAVERSIETQREVAAAGWTRLRTKLKAS